MSTPRRSVAALGVAILWGWGSIALACTSIVVSRGASRDGSVMVTYSADAPFMPKLLHVPGGTQKAGELVQIRGWEDDRLCGPVRQVAKTYSVVGLMNEHQLSLGETTTGGRRELRDPEGMLDYDALMLLTLQRAQTAREAIRTVDELAREYGYKSSGETFSIADPNEAWIMELTGKGTDQKGIVWVAARVPDGMITAHANLSRITTFPLDDPQNWLYSPDVITFAIEKKFYSTGSQKPFSFRDAYHPGIGPSQQRACAGRVWSIYRRSAGSQKFSDAFFRGKEGAEDYPLFIKPDAPLGVSDVMALMRDHYEGTPYDMTKGLDAGPFGTPYRFRETTLQGGWRGLYVGAADFHPAGGFRHREPEPQGDAGRRGGRDLVYAGRRFDLMFHPVLLRNYCLAGPVFEGGLQQVRLGLGVVGVKFGLEPLLRPLVTNRSRFASRPVPARGRSAQVAAGDRGSRREAGINGFALDA
jgi:dipeptidase